MTFAKTILLNRTSLDLSRRYLSNLTEISVEILKLIETDKYDSKITVKQLITLSEVLQLDINGLMDLL